MVLYIVFVIDMLLRFLHITFYELCYNYNMYLYNNMKSAGLFEVLYILKIKKLTLIQNYALLEKIVDEVNEENVLCFLNTATGLKTQSDEFGKDALQRDQRRRRGSAFEK